MKRPRQGEHLQVRFDGYDAEGQAVGSWRPAPAPGGAKQDGPGPHAPPAQAWEIHAPWGARDDLARVELLHVSPHHGVAWARILEVLEPSPRRCLPFDFPGHRCGGCGFAHLGPEEQLWAKGERLSTLAARFPGAALASPPVRPAERLTAYRNRGKYVLGLQAPPGPRGRPQGARAGAPRRSEAPRPVLGAFLPRSHRVVSTLGCPVMEPAVERAAAALEGLLGETRLSLYDETSGQGLLRYAAIRANHRGEVLVTLVTARTPEGPSADEDLAPLVLGLCLALPDLVGVTLDVNPTRGNVLFSGDEQVLHGAAVLEERYGPARVSLTGEGFGQVNREQAAAIYQAAAEAALAPLGDRGAPKRIWELYAGAGALSQVVAHQAGDRADLWVLGIERDPRAVAQANQAARDLGLAERLQFRAADASEALWPPAPPDPAGAEEGYHDPHDPFAGPPDVVALDPPRTGCRPPLLEGLCRARVPRVVYVSCDPETLGRDLSLLERGGYVVRSLGGFDLMPQTPHLEVLAVAEWSTRR